ncbi:hypothetical protein BH11BAC7_BH11BAC7_01930 [soil metagenome]
MSRNFFFTFCIAVSATLFFAFSEDEEAAKKKYAATITAADLKKHLSVIASDEYEGRETGKKGQHMTAEYIAKQFASFGIPPLPGNLSQEPNSYKDYYQNVPLVQFKPGSGSIKTQTQSFSFGSDFYYTNGIEDQKVHAENIVFAGYGIQEGSYRDYDKLDVTGKAVMVLSEEPTDKKGNSRITGTQEASTWTTNRRRKSGEARNRKAKVLLIVVPDFQNRYNQNRRAIESPTLQLDEAPKMKGDPDMPVVYISKETADRLLKEGNQKQTIEQLIAKSKKKKPGPRFSFPQAIDIAIERTSEKLNSENVLGYIEGTDLKKELVVVTAHMDHLGKDSLIVFNGADDDGSGTVAVIEMAEAFAIAKKEGHGPRRSILFMLVTGEEKGLLGSKWYTDHPVFPLANTVCDLNIDMIGRIDPAHKNDTNYVYVIGSDRLSTELKTINEKNNARYTGMLLDYKYDVPNEPNNFYGRSDHYNFAKNNIPIAFFFNGTHADYHKESDEVSKINFPLMERRTLLVFYNCWEIANRDQRLIVDVKK